jgi:serine protease Do
MTRKSIASYVAVAGIAAAVTAGFSPFGMPEITSAHALNLAPTAPPVAAPLGVPSRPLPDIATLVEQQGPAVVNIKVSSMSKTSSADLPDELKNSPFGEFFRRFGVPGGGQQSPGVPSRGEGSGFIVSPDGVVLTNAHVVDGASTVTVRLTDGRDFEAKVIGVDKRTDIAVLRIDAKGLPTVRIGNPASTRVGEWVVAIGSPYGFENTVTAGIVSAKSRSLPEENYVPFIQTDAAVNPGNSGGPLFNLAGEVIGVNSQIYSRTGGYQGLSFAIPIDVAMRTENQLVAHGKVSRAKLGVAVQEIDRGIADSFGLPNTQGALVATVEKGGPASGAGMQEGDVILKFNGRAITRSGDLPLAVGDAAPGSSANIEVWRKGRIERLTAKLTELTDAKVAEASSPSGAKSDGGKLGLAVRPLTADERREAEVSGGLVVEEARGPAALAGLQQGDVILALNGKPVNSAEELRNLTAKGGKTVALLVQREGGRRYVAVPLG